MTRFATGWLLFALMIALTLFNARKKLPFLPVLSAKAWMQFHIWVGFASAAVFFWHAGRPMSWFGIVFTALYALVMMSGIVGWIWSRRIPRQLTARGGEVIFEQIPARRAALRAQAETLALQSPLLGKFYVEQLHDSWAGAMAKLDNLKKFLDEKERTLADQLAALARENDDLDFHHARQLRLKGWLFVHIPLTYSLMIFSVVHIVIVYAFSGGAP
jgi:cell division protein FtsB